jgi:hypothetical protein
MCIGHAKIWFIEAKKKQKTKNLPVTIFTALTGPVTALIDQYTEKTVWTTLLIWEFEFKR